MSVAKRPILALIGPTAVGKTGLSLDLVERITARTGHAVEIVSADSRQIYRELTIGTAKPSSEELGRVRHHFVDEKAVTEAFSAGRFAQEAETRIASILDRGATPLLVGGSTLYIEALVHGIAEIPPTTADTRTRLTERLKHEGPDTLFDELRERDPEAAQSMDPTKSQRIVRALEVLTDTGHPISYWQRQAPAPRFHYDVLVLDRPRDQLYARIEARVDLMLDAGLLSEVESLRDQGVSQDLPALKTIGYREPFAYLQGDIDYDKMGRLLKRNTRRYAKRQLTWFRRRSTYTWIDLATQTPHSVIDRIVSRLPL